MRKSYKFKAKINKETQDNCFFWLNHCRELYNAALEARILAYKHTGKSPSTYDQHKDLPIIKAGRPEFKNINSQTLQAVIDTLGKAYQSFFGRVKRGEKAGFPRFKGRDRYHSFTLKQSGWKLDGRNLFIKNVGRFKLYLSREIEGDIKTVTVKKTPSGDWFVTFSCDNVPEKPVRHDHTAPREVGVDVGIAKFLVTSDGGVEENNRYLTRSKDKLRLKQRSLARKKKRGKNRNKQRIQVSKYHRKVTNQRNDFQWKAANKLVTNYDRIYVEDLKIKNMVKNHCLARSISDVAWGMFIGKLIFKAEEAGKEVVKVNPKYTSQKCSECSHISPENRKTQADFLCVECGHSDNADLNAAKNILRVGQTQYALTSSTRKCVA